MRRPRSSTLRPRLASSTRRAPPARSRSAASRSRAVPPGRRSSSIRERRWGPQRASDAHAQPRHHHRQRGGGRLAGSNTNGGSADGGGIYNAGTLNLVNSDVNGNSPAPTAARITPAVRHPAAVCSASAQRRYEARRSRETSRTPKVAGTRTGVRPRSAAPHAAAGCVLAQAGPTSISDTTLRDNVADGSVRAGRGP